MTSAEHTEALRSGEATAKLRKAMDDAYDAWKQAGGGPITDAIAQDALAKAREARLARGGVGSSPEAQQARREARSRIFGVHTYDTPTGHRFVPTPAEMDEANSQYWDIADLEHLPLSEIRSGFYNDEENREYYEEELKRRGLQRVGNRWVRKGTPRNQALTREEYQEQRESGAKTPAETRYERAKAKAEKLSRKANNSGKPTDHYEAYLAHEAASRRASSVKDDRGRRNLGLVQRHKNLSEQHLRYSERGEKAFGQFLVEIKESIKLRRGESISLTRAVAGHHDVVEKPKTITGAHHARMRARAASEKADKHGGFINHRAAAKRHEEALALHHPDSINAIHHRAKAKYHNEEAQKALEAGKDTPAVPSRSTAHLHPQPPQHKPDLHPGDGKRRVRTPEGARRYKVPIGTVITAEMRQAAAQGFRGKKPSTDDTAKIPKTSKPPVAPPRPMPHPPKPGYEPRQLHRPTREMPAVQSARAATGRAPSSRITGSYPVGVKVNKVEVHRFGRRGYRIVQHTDTNIIQTEHPDLKDAVFQIQRILNTHKHLSAKSYVRLHALELLNRFRRKRRARG